MKLLLTGSTGFLGKVILSTLREHEIITLARSDSHINVDLSAVVPKLGQYDMVIHAAGKAHMVPKTRKARDEFFKANVGGTLNLLKGLERSGLPKTLVFISSVSVYGAEQGENIGEDASLNASSPYGLSKIESERKILDWGIKHKVPVTILRLPLIVGSSPVGNLEKLVNAISKSYYFRIGSVNSLKSMVLAEDVAKLLPQLLYTTGVYNLTDGRDVLSTELENHISKHFNKKIKTLPYVVIKTAAKIGDFMPFLPINTGVLNKLTSTLTFSSELAKKELNWNPTSVLKGTWL